MFNLVKKICNYCNTPKTLAKCKLNYCVSSVALIASAAYLCLKFKNETFFMNSVYFDAVVAQFIYGIAAAFCWLVLNKKNFYIKIVSILNFTMLFFPLVYFFIIHKYLLFGSVDFFKYSIGISAIFLYDLIEFDSYRSGVYGE